MNSTWTKDKYHKIFSTDNIAFHASGDAATAGQHCRVCGGDSSLRAAEDTFVCDGVEERCDKLLFNCFGLTISPPDSLLCEWCVRQLRNIERFRAMVHAALVKPLNFSNPPQEKSLYKYPTKSNADVATISQKDIMELLKNKMAPRIDGARRRQPNLARKVNSKKTSMECVMCMRKFSVSRSNTDDFICSRCKRSEKYNNVNRLVPKNALRRHVERHDNFNLRGKNSYQKKPQINYQEMQNTSLIAKFHCQACPKRYATSQHLIEHIKCMHGNKRKAFCEICGIDFKVETFDKHILRHAVPDDRFQKASAHKMAALKRFARKN